MKLEHFQIWQKPKSKTWYYGKKEDKEDKYINTVHDADLAFQLVMNHNKELQKKGE
jgi:hypothetical protein